MAKEFLKSNQAGPNRVCLDIDSARKLCVRLGANRNWAYEAGTFRLHAWLTNFAALLED
jgi:hypothetical protein